MKIAAGQAAVVTGGSSGIGFALAALLVRRGVNVMIADIREDSIPVAVDALSGNPGRAAGVRADVSVSAEVRRIGRRDHREIRPGRPRLQQRGRGVPAVADVGATVGILAVADRRQAHGCRPWGTGVRSPVHRAGLGPLSQHRIGGWSDASTCARALQRHHARGRRIDRDSQCRIALGIRQSRRHGVVSGPGGNGIGGQLVCTRACWGGRYPGSAGDAVCLAAPSAPLWWPKRPSTRSSQRWCMRSSGRAQPTGPDGVSTPCWRI